MTVPNLSQAQTAARNALGLFAGTVGEGALQFAFVVMASRFLGPENFGFWGFGLALISYLLIAAGFGLPQIVVREIARAPEEAPQIFGSAIGLRLFFGIIVFVVLMVVLPLTQLPPDRRMMLLVLSFALFVMPFDLAPFLDAHKQSRWDALFRVSARAVAVGALGLVILMRGGMTLPMAALTNLTFLVVNISLAWAVLRRLELPLRPSPSVPRMRWIFKLALPIFWARAMSELYVHTNLILLGFFSTDRETGFYALADRILVVLLTLKAIIYRLLVPLLSEVAQDRERLTKRLETVIPLLAQVTIPTAVAVILVAEPIIRFVFTDVYLQAVLPFRILTGYLIFTGVGSIFGTTLFAMGLQREYSLSITVGTAANLVLCAFLIPTLGAVGAAISSASAELVVLVMSFLYFRKHLRPRFGMSLLRTLAASAVLAVVYILTPLNGDLAFIGKLFAGVIAAFITLWLTGELNRSRIETLRQLFRKQSE